MSALQADASREHQDVTVSMPTTCEGCGHTDRASTVAEGTAEGADVASIAVASVSISKDAKTRVAEAQTDAAKNALRKIRLAKCPACGRRRWRHAGAAAAASSAIGLIAVLVWIGILVFAGFEAIAQPIFVFTTAIVVASAAIWFAVAARRAAADADAEVWFESENPGQFEKSDHFMRAQAHVEVRRDLS